MPSSSNLERHLGFWLRFVSNHVSGAFGQRLAAHGVTVAEWVALRSILALGACSLSELSVRMGADPSTVSRLVERVLQKGLAARVNSTEDRRRVRIELTQAGRELVPKLSREADANDAYFFGHMPVKDAKYLSRVLQQLVLKHGWKDKPME